MARALRIQFPGAFYHVTSRDNEQKAVFKSVRDKDRFLKGMKTDRELPALREITNRPGLDQIEQVVDSVLQADEKLVRQVKLYLCHRYRARAKTTYHFGIPARQKDGGSTTSGYLGPILIRKTLEIACYSCGFAQSRLGGTKSNPNLSANSAKFFLREPIAARN